MPAIIISEERSVPKSRGTYLSRAFPNDAVRRQSSSRRKKDLHGNIVSKILEKRAEQNNQDHGDEIGAPVELREDLLRHVGRSGGEELAVGGEHKFHEERGHGGIEGYGYKKTFIIFYGHAE